VCYLGRVRSSLRPLASLCGAALVLLSARAARADASAWLFAGGGATSWKNGDATTLDPMLAFDLGVGTSPRGRFIAGGLVRLAPILGQGSDLSLLARGATRGFQAGDFGLAVDAGIYGRFWGAESTGFAGGLTLGAPLGAQLSVQTMIGSHDAFAVSAVLGLDLLRLTVYRRTLLDWWPNPSPEPSAPAPGASARF
jgi:hypothetical protein